MKILIASDSFKGSISSLNIGKALESGIKETRSQTVIEIISVADGGEGSLEAINNAIQGAICERSFLANDHGFLFKKRR
jgi:glycerate kinase